MARLRRRSVGVLATVATLVTVAALATSLRSGGTPVVVRCGAVATPPRGMGVESPEAAPIEFVEPATDNYKARNNGNPAAPECRTWLHWEAIRAGEETWRVPEGSARHIALFERVRSSSGADGTLLVRRVSGVAGEPFFRTEATGLTGAMLAIERSRLAVEPVVLEVQLVPDDGGRYRAMLHYRFEPSFAFRVPPAIEANGPAGRWYLDGRATPTDTGY